MAYNNELGMRLEGYLKGLGDDVTSKKMFGGLCFLYKGKMCAGVVGDKLMARIVDEEFEQALNEKGAEPMDFTGKPMKNFAYVREEGIQTEVDLSKWVERGLKHARTQLGEI